MIARHRQFLTNTLGVNYFPPRFIDSGKDGSYKRSKPVVVGSNPTACLGKYSSVGRAPAPSNTVRLILGAQVVPKLYVAGSNPARPNRRACSSIGRAIDITTRPFLIDVGHRQFLARLSGHHRLLSALYKFGHRKFLTN